MARAREKQASTQLEISRQLLEEDRWRTEKLAAESRRNQFSDMIRDALAVGYDLNRKHDEEGREGA